MLAQELVYEEEVDTSSDFDDTTEEVLILNGELHSIQEQCTTPSFVNSSHIAYTAEDITNPNLVPPLKTHHITTRKEHYPQNHAEHLISLTKGSFANGKSKYSSLDLNVELEQTGVGYRLNTIIEEEYWPPPPDNLDNFEEDTVEKSHINGDSTEEIITKMNARNDTHQLCSGNDPDAASVSRAFVKELSEKTSAEGFGAFEQNLRRPAGVETQNEKFDSASTTSDNPTLNYENVVLTRSKSARRDRTACYENVDIEPIVFRRHSEMVRKARSSAYENVVLPLEQDQTLPAHSHRESKLPILRDSESGSDFGHGHSIHERSGSTKPITGNEEEDDDEEEEEEDSESYSSDTNNSYFSDSEFDDNLDEFEDVQSVEEDQISFMSEVTVCSEPTDTPPRVCNNARQSQPGNRPRVR